MLLALGSAGLAASVPGFAAPADSAAGSLTVQQSTHGAAGGPFTFELSSSVLVAAQQGSATTTSADEPATVIGLDVDLPAGTYVLQQALDNLPADANGAQWEFTGVECDGAPATVDATTGTATIRLDPGADATCTVTDTSIAVDPPAADAPATATPTSTTTPATTAAALDDPIGPLAIPPLD